MLLILFAFLLFSASGCVTTHISLPPPDPSLPRLERTAERALSLRVSPPKTPLKLGHQYLGVVVPFGSIYLTEPTRAVEDALRLELALAGIRAVSAGDAMGLPTVTVTLAAASVTAFDLIVTRRVHALAVLTVVAQRADRTFPPLSFEARGENAAFERFGFAPELRTAFGEALRSAAGDAVMALQSAGAFSYHDAHGAVSQAAGSP